MSAEKTKQRAENDKGAAVFALGSGSKLKSNEGAAEEAGAGTGGASKNMLPTPTRATGRGTWGAAATAPGGRGGGGALTGFGGALGFQPGGISPIPGSICGRLPTAGAGAAPVRGAAMSRRVTLIFCSSAGAALQPNTVQPPFSV